MAGLQLSVLSGSSKIIARQVVNGSRLSRLSFRHVYIFMEKGLRKKFGTKKQNYCCVSSQCYTDLFRSYSLHFTYRVFNKYCVFPLKFLNFMNSASSAAALVFYLLGVCTHTDTEGKQRKTRVRNLLKKHNI